MTEIALKDAAEPRDVPLVGRQVELELLAECSDRFLGSGLAQNGLGQISRQQFDPEKDDQGNDEEGEEAQRQALGHHRQDLCHTVTRIAITSTNRLVYANHHRSVHLKPSIDQFAAILPWPILSERPMT